MGLYIYIRIFCEFIQSFVQHETLHEKSAWAQLLGWVWLGNCLPNGKTIEQVTNGISEIKSTPNGILNTENKSIANDISNTKHFKLFLFVYHIKIFFHSIKKKNLSNKRAVNLNLCA
jgi:hypothetical protein